MSRNGESIGAKPSLVGIGAHYPGILHQHFNTGKTEPARFFAVTTMPLMVNTGIFTAEQLEGVGKV